MPVRVRLLGHLAYNMNRPEIEVEKGKTVKEVLDEIYRLTEDRMARSGVLVAVNGVEVSALEGQSTVLHDNDLVELIPVIHGGIGRLPP